MKPTNESGIYEIIHLETGRRYIGSAKNFQVRWKAHKTALRSGTHHSPFLQHAWSKYGEEAFLFQVISHCEADMLLHYEQRAIDESAPEFNINKTAGSRLGMAHSPETIEKMKAKVVSEETRLNMSAAQKGRIITDAHRANISAAQLGVPKKEEVMKRTNFYFPEQMLERLKAAQAKLGIPVSQIIRQAVDEFLKRMKL